jgi:hypothetical protein
LAILVSGIEASSSMAAAKIDVADGPNSARKDDAAEQGLVWLVEFGVVEILNWQPDHFVYIVIRGRALDGGVGAAGEIDSVSQAL